MDKERQKIDAIDQKLVALLIERLQVGEQIAQIKFEQKLGLTDIMREKNLLDELMTRVEDEHLRPYIKDLFRDILLVSKQVQAKKIKALQDTQ
ncbi:chorismate mutase [Agrilactobacillus fermenti]|uniref:chorismate mutase n=1 Tax=Agrilactobacillus fermenti TaxID=2586909 RepID=UPI001E4574F4|nr:chorismate mutase [Agrilactobacillus fermenti]MCD2255992.1 chorismate mutase [Agrilactobacillus fermenti]